MLIESWASLWICGVCFSYEIELISVLRESTYLVTYGLILEFMGRFPVLISDSALDRDQLELGNWQEGQGYHLWPVMFTR